MNDADKQLRKVIRQKRDTEQSVKPKITEEKRKEQIKKWTTFYRRNLEIYVEDRLGIKLRPFQRIMIHMMGVSQVWFGICSRGSSKSFISSVYVLARAMIAPYTLVVITASTIDQGRKMVDSKIKNELVNKLSPVLQYMYNTKVRWNNGEYKEMMIIKSSKDEVQIDLFNGSCIKVLPPLDSSRGE